MVEPCGARTLRRSVPATNLADLDAIVGAENGTVGKRRNRQDYPSGGRLD
jgi:hypothetical protein